MSRLRIWKATCPDCGIIHERVASRAMKFSRCDDCTKKDAENKRRMAGSKKRIRRTNEI